MTFAVGSQLMEIGKDAFCECSNLVLMLPEGLTSIGKEWFKGSGIKEVHIPASVQSIGENAFYECRNLQKVTFANSSQLRKIGKEAFAGNYSITNKLTEVHIPASVQTIGKESFRMC